MGNSEKPSRPRPSAVPQPVASLQDRVTYLRALSRTVPPTIVDWVLTHGTELAPSQQCDGTLLNADLVGFTSICEEVATAGPDQLESLTSSLNRLFTRLLEEALFPYGGLVMQFGGDSITALFRGDDHMFRAAAAALHAQKIMRSDDFGLKDVNGRRLVLRVGIAQGVVTMPIVGDVVRRGVVCAGMAAHRAVTHQHRATPGTVLADLSIAERLRDRARVGETSGDAAVLLDLLSWPERQPIPKLPENLAENVEAKIALLEPFVPAPLAARLRTTPEGWRIEGELRKVVVLFADITGIDHEVAPEVQLNLSRSAIRSYRKYGGIVAKVNLADEGQRVMVLFGLHMPSQHDAERAVLAALEATARVKGYLSGIGSTIGVRSGVHVGQVYFGAFGSEHRHDITVVGDAVNTAARVAESAGPFEVLVTEEALSTISEEFVTSARPPIRVRGKQDLLAVRSVHSAAEGAAHYMQSRRKQRILSGREREMETLRELAARASAGNGVMVGIAGERGYGKSAVLSLIVDEWISRGGIGMLGRCRYATKTEPLAPVVSMFTAFLGITASASDDDRNDRIRHGLEPFRLSAGAPELMALLQPVRRPDGAHEAIVDLADVDARERVLASIVEFVDRRVEQERLLYVIEDVHLADSLTLDLVTRMSGIARDRPFLFLATYRTEPTVANLRRTFDEEIALGPLKMNQLEELMLRELVAESIEPGLLAFVERRTHGNPGHVVDIVRFLRDRELLAMRGGTVRLPEGGLSLLDDVVPNTAESAALAQLDGLGEIERRLARTASAIGGSFSRELLEDVARIDVDPTLLGSAVERLEAGHLFQQEANDRGYAFRDEVTRATAYRTLPEDRRRETHRRIADALEARPDLDYARDAPILAAHRERAAQWPEAAVWYGRSARFALRAMLNDEARYFVDRWEQCAERSPADSISQETRAQIALVKLIASGRVRKPTAVLALDARIKEMNTELSDHAKLAIDYWVGCALAWSGRDEEARPRLRSVWEAAEDRGMRFDAGLELAQSYARRGEITEAGQWLDHCTELTFIDPVKKGTIDVMQAGLASETDELEPARHVCARVRDDARSRGHIGLAALAASRAAWCDLELRYFDTAREGFESARLLTRSLGSWEKYARETTRIGETLLWQGRAQEAVSVLEEALRLSRDADDPIAIAEATVHLGAAIALSRDPVEGSALCDQGVLLAKKVAASEALAASTLHRLRIALVREDLPQTKILSEQCRAEAALHRTPLYKFEAKALLTLADDRLA